MINQFRFLIYYLFDNFKFKILTLFLLGVVFVTIASCKPKSFDEPEISLASYHIEEGFELQVVASEPFIEAPVAMDFDDKGRMWVVEMKGYMQNLEGTGDDMPNGTITILEDLDQDGITDHSKIFLDSLILPRAIAHVYGGLLYAEPPNLWFVDIKNDKPENKVLVDSLYSDGGNVEHQPNGLMTHIDNWIYNAKCNFRYQRKNGKWLKEPASFRGQWGISMDNFGRLYYNNNSTQLIGDYVLPNTVINNPYYKPNAAISKKLTPNQRVFPLHPTSVNRGYEKGVLDKDSLLIRVTSACGPLIYRGHQFPDMYQENAFVCVPEANLIKRNILTITADKITAMQAVPNREFIASTDEGFRPVNLFNGPDGAMYVVDMHRGIIQDKAFLTPYLQKHYAKKKLDTIIGMGRILRVVNKNHKSTKEPIVLEGLNISELVDLLSHPNGWIRDRAQQLLIYKKGNAAIPILKKLLVNANNSISQIHALHTLNGLDALDFETLKNSLSSDSGSDFISHTIVLTEQFAAQEHIVSMIKLIKSLILKDNPEIDLYISTSLGGWLQFSPEDFFPILLELSVKYRNSKVYQEGTINSLRGLEESFLQFLNQGEKEASEIILYNILNTTISNKANQIKNAIYTVKKVGTDSRTAGYNIFRNFCATCHGIDGSGIEDLAPPLKNSEYVTGAPERLALIILHGLAGPIHVNGEFYELNTIMPGLANNSDFSDSDIQGIIDYLHNAFPGNSERIELGKIKFLRNQKPKSGGVFSEKELLQLDY
jgi:mono/diheme cytochrome c family protein/glucose/arabinose dehydrogenase